MVVLWAGNFVVVKSAIAAMPPIGFAFLRFALSSLTLLAILRWREGSIRLPREDIVPMAILGSIGFGLYQVLWTLGLGSVAAGDSSLLIAATPVLVAVLAVAAGSDVLTLTRVAGAIVSFAGVAIVIGSKAGFSLDQTLVGDLLTLGAALCWAIYTAWGAPILRRHSALRTTTWTMVFGTLFLAPVGIAQLGVAGPAILTGPVLLAILYSGSLSAGIPNVVVFHGVALLGPTRVAAFQFLVPGIAVVLAYLALSEAIRIEQLIGGLVIVAGVLLTRRDGPVLALPGRRLAA